MRRDRPLRNPAVVAPHPGWHRFTEHVDLFPTLAEAAAEITLAPCPAGDKSFHVPLCTEGTSLVPLMKDPTTPVKAASFSQYPRGYQPHEAAGAAGDLFAPSRYLGKPSTSPCIMEGGRGCTMGYTLVTRVDGAEYRYTEWCGAPPVWLAVAARMCSISLGIAGRALLWGPLLTPSPLQGGLQHGGLPAQGELEPQRGRGAVQPHCGPGRELQHQRDPLRRSGGAPPLRAAGGHAARGPDLWAQVSAGWPWPRASP